MADAKELKAVLDVLQGAGCVVQVVRVGDITVQLSAPWGRRPEPAKPPPTEEEQIAKEIEPHSAAAARRELLRELSRKQLGTVHPDKQLEAIAPILLRGQRS